MEGRGDAPWYLGDATKERRLQSWAPPSSLRAGSRRRESKPVCWCQMVVE